MKLGEVSQTIEVTDAPPLLNTDTMQLGAVIDSRTDSLFEFFRNDILKANYWECNWSSTPSRCLKVRMRWNMFGGTIGGPIKKDKLFFFGDYQGQRFANPASTGTITVFRYDPRRSLKNVLLGYLSRSVARDQLVFPLSGSSRSIRGVFVAQNCCVILRDNGNDDTNHRVRVGSGEDPDQRSP